MSFPIMNGDGNLVRRVAGPIEFRDGFGLGLFACFAWKSLGGNLDACQATLKEARIDSSEGTSLQALLMAQLTVRNVTRQVVRALKRRAAAHGRSAEAEHREILRRALLERDENFASRVKSLRQRLRSSVDSSEVIRADRNRDNME